MSGNIVKEIPKEEEKKFFKTNYKSSSFCYGIFEEKQPISVISVGKPKDNNLKYQYEILNYSGNQQQFEQLWKHFLNGHSCHSCICRKDLPFLENFGFKKNNNFYSYYPFSVVYRADDLTDGKFYIGMSEVENSWKNGYLGSGRYWNNHKNAYPNHKYRRTILKKNFDTPLDTRDFELQEIEKVFNDENNCNSQKRTQGQSYFSTKECKECSGKSGHHKKGCSKYKELLACPECGGKKGNHKKGCSQYKEKTVPVPCSECGGKFGHKKTCSQYKEPKPCQECGRTRSHKKSCSQYKEPKKCSECGLTHGNHKKSCPFYKEPKICPECNGIDGAHFKTCLHYTPPEACSECGALYGKHKDSCSHSKGKCQYCGYSLRSNKHSKDCPLYKEPSICSECGGKGGNHKRNCSKAIKCPECGVSGGGHLSSCSKYKRKVCSYCGSAYRHKKTCPLYKELKSCPECGAKGGNHKKNCSFSKKCSECGGSSGTHLKNCSHYKTPTPCPECGSVYGHKDFCSKAEGKCKYCGYSLRSRHHSKDCPLYKKFKSSKSF